VGRNARKCISISQSGHWSGLAIWENKSSVMVLISVPCRPVGFYQNILGSAAQISAELLNLWIIAPDSQEHLTPQPHIPRHCVHPRS
jgi:hypothetical protein